MDQIRHETLSGDKALPMVVGLLPKATRLRPDWNGRPSLYRVNNMTAESMVDVIAGCSPSSNVVTQNK